MRLDYSNKGNIYSVLILMPLKDVTCLCLCALSPQVWLANPATWYHWALRFRPAGPL